MVVFYLGDWDASGEAIEQDVKRRVLDYRSGSFETTRLAIHEADIRKFHLPPLLVKATDPRSSTFIRQHGRNAVELDALPPAVLRERLDRAIQEKVEMQRWDRAIQLETAERETTARLARVLANRGCL